MNNGNPSSEEIADWLTTCVGKCRRAQSAAEVHTRLYRKPWNQELLDRFKGQCRERPDLAWIMTMLWAEAHSGLARDLLPNLERCLGRFVYDEFAVEIPPAPLRPEIVVDNSGGTETEAPAGSRGNGRRKKGKRADLGRPAGDAA